MNKFYKIGFFALLAIILMASTTLPSLIEIKPATPKQTVVFRDDLNGDKIKVYAKQGYILKQMVFYDYIGDKLTVVMEKY